MDKLIVIKLTAFSLFFSFFLFNLSKFDTSKEVEADIVTQVVKICHVSDQAFGIPLNCSDPNSVNIIVDENGTGIMKLDVRAANLMPAFGYYTPPSSNIDPMYIEYDLPDGGFAVSDEILEFQPENSPLLPPDLYVSQVELVFNFTRLCENNNDQRTPFTSNVRLVSSNNLEFPNPYYDVHQYSGSSQLFPCEIFFETCGNGCSNPPTNCTGGTANSQADVYFCIDCVHDGGSGKSETNLGKEEFSFSAKASPNPFQQFFDINYDLTKSSAINIKIYDIKGNLIKGISTNGMKGNNQIKVNSHDWGYGVYYLQLSDAENTQTLKLVKL